MTSVYQSPEGKRKILAYYDDARKYLSIDTIEHQVDTPYGTTYVLETGNPDAPALLLFHGSCSNSAMWFGDMPHLAGQFRVLSVDLLGEPGHSDENRPDFQSGDHARWIDCLRRHFQLDTVRMMGNSMGAWMTLQYAAHYPQHVDKMVIIAPSGIVPARLSFVFKSIIYAMQGEKGMKKLGQLIVGDEALPAAVEQFNLLIGQEFKPVIGGLPPVTDAQLAGMQMPILLMCGADDVTLNAAKLADRLRSHCPQAHIQLIPDNGHVIYDVASKVDGFLMG